ncbi:MAG: sulfatase family protein, partial [Candidatus Binatia bacterium]
PSFHTANGSVPPHVRSLYQERELGQRNRDGQRVFAVTEREAREAIALTYGMITMIDDAVGRILSRLTALGFAEDTVIIFNSDHADFMGDHQLLLKGALHYQGLVRVPFIWSDPAVSSKGGVNSGLCGTLDIAHTILDRAGLEGHNGMQGMSLLPMVAGDNSAHDSLLIEEHQRRGYMGFDNNFRARSLITRDARLTIYQGVEWGELYDLTSDPNEMNNLWSERNARPKRDELTEALARKMMALADTSPLATHHGP